MDDEKHLVFCRCWYGLDPAFPLDRFADIFSEELLEVAIREASCARIPEGAPDELDLDQLVLRAGWRAKKRGILAFDREGRLIDPVYSPTRAILVLDSKEDALVARQVLRGRLPSSVSMPLAHRSPCVPTLGVVATSRLEAGARVECNIELQEQARELARWPEGPTREIHLHMMTQPGRMFFRLAAHAGDVYQQLAQPESDAGAYGAPEQLESPEATPEPTSPPGEGLPEGNCFRREGSHWRVKFGGVSRLISHLQGFSYIHRLLLADGKPVSVADLTPIVENSDKPMPRIDEAGLRDLKSSMKAVEKELATAVEHNDLATQARLREELRALAAEYKESGGLGPGRRRTIGDGRDAARTRVGKAIEYACSKLDAEIEGLGSHLRGAIKNPNGLAPHYSLSEGERWEL